MKKILSFTLLLLLVYSCTHSAPFGETTYSIRALSTPSDKVIWTAAQNGFWARSIDGGLSWDTGHVPGMNADIRDMEAFDENSAVVMGVGSPALIYRTTNGGKSWREVFRLDHPDAFLDNMDFNAQGEGLVIGDPIDGRWTILGSHDRGAHWVQWNVAQCPEALPNEAAFAASGSGLIVNDSSWVFFSGGSISRMYLNRSAPWTIDTDTGTTFGVYSALQKSPHEFLIVGGDFRAEDERQRTAATIRLNGNTWGLHWHQNQPPRGYRSSVIQHGNYYLCTGPNGTDYSTNGTDWLPMLDEGYHVLSSSGSRVWAAGSDGRLKEITEDLPQ